MNKHTMAISILEAALMPGKTPLQIRVSIRAALELLRHRPPSKRRPPPRPKK
jgi:hypothetical protein